MMGQCEKSAGRRFVMIKGEAGAPTHALRVVGWDAYLRAEPAVSGASLRFAIAMRASGCRE